MVPSKSKNISPVAQISKRAKKTRRKNEPWTKAIQRASKELKSNKKGLGNFSKKKVTYKIQGLGALGNSNKTIKVPEVKLTFTSKPIISGKAGSASEVAEIVSKFYSKNTIEVREQFFVLYLNNSNKILGYHKHSVGGIKGSLVDLRILFSVALKSLATSIIIAHNHPSGTLKPSTSDIQITNKIRKAGELFDIQLLDHIILTKDNYYSFAEEGKL